ncbi:MAG: RsmG family class I SAM-dependent methyltransferase, partial [Myxococcota bacterium]|nr:RsmG family class I SAM-dependent methyltransferase [Myxococcota bacterium]
MSAPTPVVDPAWLAERLAEPAARFGVAVDSATAEALAGLSTRLLAWSRRTNLTGARDAAALADAHLADAFALMPDLEDVRGSLLDVGSGGGLPGLVLAILRPDLEVVLLEPIGKKHAFLRRAVRELGLARARPRRERLEAYRASPAFRLHDAAVSRATFPLGAWLVLGLELVRPGGRVLGLAGAERVALPAGAARRPYRRPGSEV